MSAVPFYGQRAQMSRDEAIELYILLRLRFEDIRRLMFLVENLHARKIQLPSESPFTHVDLKDTARTAFFGWFATLTDKNGRALYAFDALFALFPDGRYQIGLVQMECEACHPVLHRFRNNVAFHGRAEVAAQINARQALRQDDTFLDLESARQDFHRLMTGLIAEELRAIPELPQKLAEFGVSHHPAFANVVSAVPSTSARRRLSVLELRGIGVTQGRSMEPKWFRLLYEQQYGDGITAHGPVSGSRVGLTPSFLVGAMRTPPGAVRDPANSRGELSALLKSMRDNVSGQLVCIAECNNLHQPITSLTKGEALGHLGDAVLLPDGSPSKLYAWPQYFARASRDVESLADGLWKILESSICERRFSYRGSTWQEFDEHDLAFIRQALANGDA